MADCVWPSPENDKGYQLSVMTQATILEYVTDKEDQFTNIILGLIALRTMGNSSQI